MTLQVDYIPNSTGGGAVVMSQSDYITAAPNGVSDGLADPTFENKGIRQSSMFAAALANIISTTLQINVLDDGNLSALITNLTATIEALAGSGLSLGFNAPLNLRIGAAVGSNQLTVSLLGTNGSAPSTSNPVTIPFRDVTIANGDLVARQVTAATTFTIASGSTMGVAANNQAFRLWLVAFDNAGTVVLGLMNCSVAGQIFPLNEDALQTSQAGTTGGSTAGLFYAAVSAVTAKAIRILGYLEWAGGLPTAGVWSAGPTKIQLFGPGQRKPGDPVQVVAAAAASVTLTPSSPVNQILVRAKETLAIGASGSVTTTLKRGTSGGTTIDTQAPANGSTTNTTNFPVFLEALDNPYVSASQQYTIANSAGTPSNQSLVATEIMG